MRLGGAVVLQDVSIHAGPGEVVGVVGPNGCGKSTLLKTLVGVLRPTSGCVRLDDVDITQMSARRRAQSVATVLQETPSDFDLCARDVVAMGRAPFKRMFERDDGTDARLIDEALALVDGRHLASVPIASMSGGERQRVMIARALAQQPRLLVLDEPTNHLDIRHQFDALALPRRLGVTAVIALHDLNLAAHYCDRICVMHGGRLVGSGPPAEVLTRGCSTRSTTWPPECARTRAPGAPRSAMTRTDASISQVRATSCNLSRLPTQATLLPWNTPRPRRP